MLAWHFLRKDGTSGADRKYRPSGTEVHDGPLELCEIGLHGSRRALDALAHAPGPVVRRVELAGNIIEGKDKACASIRRELWRLDATDILRKFARWCAIGMIIGHWPDAPEVVRRWLATGDESLQDAAGDAARTTTWTTPQSTARDTAKHATWQVAWDAARRAAWDAAGVAAWGATGDAAWCTAWGAAWAAMNFKLESMLLDARREKSCT